MKTRISKFLAVTAIALVTACGSSSGSDEVLLRILHLLPGGGLVDVNVEEDDPTGSNDRVSFTNVDYGESTGYFELDNDVGLIEIEALAAGTNTTVVEDTKAISGIRFSAYVGGTLSDPIIYVTEDSYSLPADGFALVRAVHGAPNVPNVDIYVSAPGEALPVDPVVENLEYTNTSGYLELPAGDYQIRITPAAVRDVLIDSGSISVASGAVVSAIATEAPSGGAPYGLTVVSDM